jgi:hypothetical protein
MQKALKSGLDSRLTRNRAPALLPMKGREYHQKQIAPRQAQGLVRALESAAIPLYSLPEKTHCQNAPVWPILNPAWLVSPVTIAV